MARLKLFPRRKYVRLIFVAMVTCVLLQILYVTHETVPGLPGGLTRALSNKTVVVNTYDSVEKGTNSQNVRINSLENGTQDSREPVKRDGTHGMADQTGPIIDMVNRAPDHFFKAPYKPLVYGTPRIQQGYLTIGIPSTRRPNTDRLYLIETIDSLVGKLPEADRKRVTIVVLVADENSTYNEQIADRLYNRYIQAFNNGLLQVIQTNSAIYPDLDKVKKTFRDSRPRLKWRAKQNIDFGYLMLYCRTISKYYLQIEDDLLAATGFLSDIENFTTYSNINTPKWFLLEFSKMGFIGKFFRSRDLEYVAKQLLKQYEDRPCDLLLGGMRVDKGQGAPIHYNTSLFQHIGWFSSLQDKLMPSKDDKFKDADRVRKYLLESIPKGHNPPAKVETNMAAGKPWTKPEYTYDGNLTSYYWASTPRTGQLFTWKFSKTYNFSRIVVQTGALSTGADTLVYGDVEYLAGTDIKDRTPYDCKGKFRKLVTLAGGNVDTKATGTSIPSDIKCLRLRATRQGKQWLIIRDLQMFL